MGGGRVPGSRRVDAKPQRGRGCCARTGADSQAHSFGEGARTSPSPARGSGLRAAGAGRLGREGGTLGAVMVEEPAGAGRRTPTLRRTAAVRPGAPRQGAARRGASGRRRDGGDRREAGFERPASPGRVVAPDASCSPGSAEAAWCAPPTPLVCYVAFWRQNKVLPSALPQSFPVFPGGAVGPGAVLGGGTRVTLAGRCFIENAFFDIFVFLYIPADVIFLKS